MYYARTEKSLILSARCVCNNLVASLSKQVVTLFGYFTHLLLASCRQTCSNLFRASDIRLVGTTCNKSNEVVNITYMLLTTCSDWYRLDGFLCIENPRDVSLNIIFSCFLYVHIYVFKYIFIMTYCDVEKCMMNCRNI